MEPSLAGLSTLHIFVEVTEQMLQYRRILAQCSNSFKVQDKHSSETCLLKRMVSYLLFFSICIILIYSIYDKYIYLVLGSMYTYRYV